MRRVHDLWPGFVTFERFIRCYKKASRGKRDRESVLRFGLRLEANVLEMLTELRDGQFEWGRYRSFWVEDPKRRLIESAPFRDRIVHHALCEVLEPLLDPAFYAHSYACRKGRGTHAAVLRLQQWMASRPGWWFLQLDVRSFFPSIDREVLYSIISRKIGDTRILDLIASQLRSAPGRGGIPIGNLTSQLFANLYLDVLDQFVKRTLRLPHYIRYMDDLVLMAPTRLELVRARSKVKQVAEEVLRLHFHPQKVALGPVDAGVAFLGYRVYPHGLWLRGKSRRRFFKKLRGERDLEAKIKRLISYRGHVKCVSDAANLRDAFRAAAFEGGLI